LNSEAIRSRRAKTLDRFVAKMATILGATMAKRSNSQTPSSVKRSIHFDALADGVLDALGTVRKLNNSELLASLLIAELYRLQGTEREAVRAVLKHLGVDVPRRASGSGSVGQGGLTDEPLDGLSTRNERLGEIVESAYSPIDDAIDSLSSEKPSKTTPRPSRFGSSN
jgi:hypothetical protein